MLTEIAIGDAYGAGFEFAQTDKLKTLKNDLTEYYTHNLPGHLPAGSYTDDTQMTLAIVEHILAGEIWSIEALANRFVEVYKRNPRNGYSRKMQELLDSVTTGDELRAILVPNSDKCGAAMRSCPLGLTEDIETLLLACHIQASITHNTSNGIESSQAVALAVHKLFYGVDPAETMNDFLNRWLGTTIDWTGWAPGTYVSTDGIEVVRAAISAACRHTKMSNILKECVDYTGDVDSVSAIALGIASVNPRVINDLPGNLYTDLENGDFGRDYLAKLDKELMDAFLPRR